MTDIRFGIRGTGSAVPSKVLSNHDLQALVETSDEWIVQRTGIRERRVLDDGEVLSDLCVAASRQALDDAGMQAEELDLIILGTVTPDRQVPSMACLVQSKLGCRTIPSFDMMAACSGFVYASDIAAQYIRTGRYRNVLVIGAEALSRIVNYADRTSCILFGDGAGAAIYGVDAQRGFFRTSELFSDGDGYEVMTQKAGGSEQPVSAEVLETSDHKLLIRGREVYKFAVGKMVELVQAEIARNPDIEFGGIVPHQVNQRIIDAARERLDLPEEAFFVNIDRFGNTSAASVPVALDEARRSGFFDDKQGKLIVMCAFGAGLTWGSMSLEW